jgi:hypothetical protein
MITIISVPVLVVSVVGVLRSWRSGEVVRRDFSRSVRVEAYVICVLVLQNRFRANGAGWAEFVVVTPTLGAAGWRHDDGYEPRARLTDVTAPILLLVRTAVSSAAAVPAIPPPVVFLILGSITLVPENIGVRVAALGLLLPPTIAVTVRLIPPRTPNGKLFPVPLHVSVATLVTVSTVLSAAATATSRIPYLGALSRELFDLFAAQDPEHGDVLGAGFVADSCLLEDDWRHQCPLDAGPFGV